LKIICVNYKQIAIFLASAGYDLILLARDQEKLSRVAKQIQSTYSCKVLCSSIDIQSKDHVQSVVNQILQTFGYLNVLVCNAGINRRKSILFSDGEILHQVMNTNFGAHMEIVRLVSPLIASNPDYSPKAIIINGSRISSHKLNGAPENQAYHASKFALLGFSNCIYHDLKPYKVKVSYLGTGLVNNDLGTKKGPYETTSGEELIQCNDICHCIEYILNCSYDSCPIQIHLAPRVNPIITLRKLHTRILSERITNSKSC